MVFGRLVVVGECSAATRLLHVGDLVLEFFDETLVLDVLKGKLVTQL